MSAPSPLVILSTLHPSVHILQPSILTSPSVTCIVFLLNPLRTPCPSTLFSCPVTSTPNLSTRTCRAYAGNSNLSTLKYDRPGSQFWCHGLWQVVCGDSDHQSSAKNPFPMLTSCLSSRALVPLLPMTTSSLRHFSSLDSMPSCVSESWFFLIKKLSGTTARSLFVIRFNFFQINIPFSYPPIKVIVPLKATPSLSRNMTPLQTLMVLFPLICAHGMLFSHCTLSSGSLRAARFPPDTGSSHVFTISSPAAILPATQ